MAKPNFKKELTVVEKAEKILKEAQEFGCEKNFFFEAQFDIYTFQLQILQQLKKTIREDGMLVQKEYVKGRKNVYAHPAIKEYNNTVNSINRTVDTLQKILKTQSEELSEDAGEGEDPLLKILQGGA